MFNDLFVKNLKEEEEIVAVIRKHWASFIKQIIITFLILVIPFFFIFFFFSRWWTMLIFLVWFCVGAGYGLYSWFVWYFDSLIITNQRIINIDQKRLFSKSVSEASLSNIQDITYEISGLMASIFSFGSVYVETAGAKSKIKIRNVARPGEVQEMIFEVKKKIKKDVSALELLKIIEDTKKENGKN